MSVFLNTQSVFYQHSVYQYLDNSTVINISLEEILIKLMRNGCKKIFHQ